MKKEVWQPIEGHENYIVSSDGKVAKILKGDDNGKGYRFIKFPNGERMYIHQIVAKTFIKNPNDYNVINHKDGNKSNNKIDNLEWCTYSHNNKESYRIGLRKPTYVKVVQKDLYGNIIKEWDSMSDIAKTLNITYQEISKCCRGERKTSHGYKWEYLQKKGE